MKRLFFVLFLTPLLLFAQVTGFLENFDDNELSG